MTIESHAHDTTDAKRILILGAGWLGLPLAKALANSVDAERIFLYSQFIDKIPR